MSFFDDITGGRDLLRRSILRLRLLFLPATGGLHIGDNTLDAEADSGGNIDPFWKRADGTSSNLSDQYTDAEAITAVEGEATLDLAGDVTIGGTKSLSVDTINEKDAAAGVTIDSVLLKDGKLDVKGVIVEDTDGTPVGDVLLEALDERLHVLDEAAATLVDIVSLRMRLGGTTVDDVVFLRNAISHAAELWKGDFSTLGNLLVERQICNAEIQTNTIIERTGAAGVTIDSVLLKDGVVTVGDVAFDDATSDPADVGTTADGTENSVARKDHVHAGVAIIDRDLDQVDHANSTTETSLYSHSIPADTLGATGGFRVHMAGDLLINDAAAVTLQIAIKLGSTTAMITAAADFVDSATRRLWVLNIYCINTATNAQQWSAEFLAVIDNGTGFGVANGDSNISIHMCGIGTSAEDTTGTLTFDVTADWGTGVTANDSIRKETAIMELLPTT